jgi:hypothetical protein
VEGAGAAMSVMANKSYWFFVWQNLHQRTDGAVKPPGQHLTDHQGAGGDDDGEEGLAKGELDLVGCLSDPALTHCASWPFYCDA